MNSRIARREPLKQNTVRQTRWINDAARVLLSARRRTVPRTSFVACLNRQALLISEATRVEAGGKRIFIMVAKFWFRVSVEFWYTLQFFKIRCGMLVHSTVF